MASLVVNREQLRAAGATLATCSNELDDLRRNLESSFVQLRRDWQSDAGDRFFEKFNQDLTKNLIDYVRVFRHMSNNLRSASSMYDEVFNAADAVANAQY